MGGYRAVKKYSKKGLAVKSLAILLAIACFITLIYVVASEYLSFTYIQQKSEILKQYVDSHYIYSALYFLFIFTMLIAVGLPVNIPLALLASYAFGLLPGFIISSVASCIGATLLFLFVRYFLRSLIQKRYQTKIEEFNARIQGNWYSYLIAIQLFSVFPYFVTASLCAISGVPVFTFMWTLFVGSAPLIFICSLAGRQFRTIHSAGDILSPNIIILLILLALIACIPMFIKKFTQKKS